MPIEPCDPAGLAASRIEVAAVEGGVAEGSHLAFDPDGVAASEVNEKDVAGEECGVVVEFFGWVKHSSFLTRDRARDVERRSVFGELK